MKASVAADQSGGFSLGSVADRGTKGTCRCTQTRAASPTSMRSVRSTGLCGKLGARPSTMGVEQQAARAAETRNPSICRGEASRPGRTQRRGARASRPKRLLHARGVELEVGATDELAAVKLGVREQGGEQRAIGRAEPNVVVEVRGARHKRGAKGPRAERGGDAPARRRRGVDGDVDRRVCQEVLLEENGDASGQPATRAAHGGEGEHREAEAIGLIARTLEL